MPLAIHLSCRGWPWFAGLCLCVSAAFSATAQDGPVMARYSLVDAQVRQAAGAVSAHTGVAMAMQEAVKGPVTLQTHHDVSRREAMALWVDLIEAHGWQTDFDERCRLHIRGQPSLLAALQKSARMYRVSGMSATEAAALVRPLLSPQGELGVPDQQRLLVMDTARVHVRIHLMPMDDAQAGKSIGDCGLQSPPSEPMPQALLDGEPRLRISPSLQPQRRAGAQGGL